MARYATVVLTSEWDPFVEKQIDITQAHVTSGDLFVLANETSGSVRVPRRFSKMSVTESDVGSIALQPLYEETLFCYNLDYLYALFFLKNPNYDYYVFLDFSASLNVDVDGLVAKAADDKIDMIAEPIEEPLDTWVYSHAHHAMYPPKILEGVSLPIIILSKTAVAHLLKRRRQLSRQYEAGLLFHWPFCEVFVPTELKIAGFNSELLSHYGSVEHFTWWPPVLDGTLPAARNPGFIHPVLDRRRYVAALLKHTSSRDLLGRRLFKEGLKSIAARDYALPLVSEINRRFGRMLVNLRSPVGKASSRNVVETTEQ